MQKYWKGEISDFHYLLPSKSTCIFLHGPLSQVILASGVVIDRIVVWLPFDAAWIDSE